MNHHDFGPDVVVHPVHPHEDDPRDGAWADPYDAVSYRHGEAWCNRHDEPAETCSCGRKYTLAHTVAVLFVACVILAAAVEMWRAIAG